MCGIAAVVDPATPPDVSRAAMARMLDRLHHRGPNDRGAMTDGAVTIGMCRLSVIDVSADGHQPMLNETGDVAVVYNGEIYNFAALRAELASAGHEFRSRTDTEVLVHGYEAWGIAGLLERLNGMYAFALWDGRRRTLYAARDRLGVKPLYLYRDGTRLLLASEVGAIAQHPAVELELDRRGVVDYLVYQFVPAPRTALRGVEKVPPGTYLEIRGTTATAHRYWTPGVGRVQLPADPRAAVAQCRDLLEESVRLQLVADVPVGMFLSGGLDSSLLAALAARTSNGPVHTFSIGFEGHEGFDESPYSEAVARHVGAEHRAIAFRGADIARLLDPVIDAMDEPIGDAAAMPTYLLAELAAREVTVVLTGEGADELFAGYGYYRDVHAAAPPAGIPLGRRVRALFGAPGPARAFGATSVSGFPYAIAAERLRALVPSITDGELAAIVRAEDELAARLTGADALATAQGWDIGSWLPDDLLMKCDKMTMAHSLEGRVPFLDHRLVDFALSLPPAMKLGADGGKAILRDVADDLLPADIVRREKHGFNLPIHRWIRGELRDRFEATLRGSAIDAIGLFDRAAVGALFERHCREEVEASRSLWTLFCLSRWWERLRRERVARPSALATAEGRL